MGWYERGQWDVDGIRALFARARTRRFRQSTYDALAIDHWVLHPPVSTDAVEAFESELGVSLPDGYRDFLLQVSDGAAGPGDGLWPLAGREADGPNGHRLEDPSGLFTHDAAVARVEHRNPDPEADDYWDDVVYRHLAGVLDIATYGDVYDVLLVLTGPRRGEVWSMDDRDYHPLFVEVDTPQDLPARHHDFVSWYCEWLDDLATHPRQLLDVREPEADAVLATIARVAQHRPPDAADQLRALVDGDRPAIAACALRALAVVDGTQAIQLAGVLIDNPDPAIGEVAFDVFVALAGPDDLALLRRLIDAAGPFGTMPMDNPRRVQLEQALHRMGQTGLQLSGQIWLEENLGRPVSPEDLERFREEMMQWQRSGLPRPPSGSLPEEAGMGPPSPEQMPAVWDELAAAGSVLREALGDGFDPGVIADAQAELLASLADVVPDETLAMLRQSFEALDPPRGGDAAG